MTDALRTIPEAAAASGDPRAERVATAVQGWQRSLVDLGGRNTLLWFRDLPSGTLDLTTAHPGGVSMLLAGRRTRLSQLVREPAAFNEARRRARAIRAKALELREERGIAAGFLAVGMATWLVPKAPRAPAAPVLLRSMVLRPTGAGQDDFEIDLGPEAELNPVLREYLRSEQGIEIDADRIADLAHTNTTFDPYPVYRELTRACDGVAEFTIAPRVVLGTFSYAKLPMVADLGLQGTTLADHDIIAALAGDEEALAAVRLRVPDPQPDPDPEREHLVLDADSSQQAAIDAVRAGAHLVIKGPPGTGKSQTIANLIAALAAEGKSTLFVAEKRAAIDAVVDRLERVGLGGLVLDAYDGTTNKRATAQQFRRALDAALGHDGAVRDSAASTLRDRRQRLVGHIEALHASRDPWGVSAHDVQQAMTELATRRPAPTSRVLLGGGVLAALGRVRVVELGRRLRDAAGLGAWTPDGDDPWYGARILSTEDASRALDITTRLSTSGLAGLAERLNEIMSESHVPAANSIADWVEAFGTMHRVRETLEVFRPEVFDMPLTEQIAATASADWRREHGVQLGWLSRWRARGAARRLLRPGRPPARLHDELVKASEQRTHWFALVGGGGRPEISPRVEEGQELLDGVTADLAWLDERLAPTADGAELMTLPLGELRERLAQLAARPDRLAVLPQVTNILDEAREAGLGEAVDDLAARGLSAEQVPAEIDHVWWASLDRELTVRDSAYGAHDGAGLRRTVSEYVAADHAHLAATVERVKSAVARNVREVVADHAAQEALVRAEGGKARRHRALRDLMPAAAATLTAVKPCWAMSPLVVASTLPPGRWFDVVVFDEASQVPPAHAISAISRARQVVVAGDERQLPPTNFFTVVSDSGEEEEPPALTDGFESVLDVLAAALPTRTLGWHYRSRDERLIAFSNSHVYDGGLTTFPGTTIESAVTFVPVAGQAEVQPGDESIETTDTEVSRVVKLVLEHARTRPDESLGVIALGIKHANRLDDAITAALEQAGDAAGFFAEDRPERFFVKNLERVQGDERDAIILSIGYGKTPHGRVLHRFGPLNIEGGERRLNVAVTRARQRMTVVSALRAQDLDPERLKAKGAIMLRDFLAYAETGGADATRGSGAQAGAEEATGRPAPERIADPLRHDLAQRLRREGLTVHEDYGSGDHRIALAVEDPYHRGRAIIAVETDGPRYAAVRSTRDRDRLRPEQLERLGWRHVRVWSTDLYRDPAREIARIRAVVKAEPSEPVVQSVDSGSVSDGAQEPEAAAPSSDDAHATGARRRRRRVFRRGTADVPEQEGDWGSSPDDTAQDWGEQSDSAERERWLLAQRPPHHE